MHWSSVSRMDSYVRFINANFDRCKGGDVGAAGTRPSVIGFAAYNLTLLIGCIGRKIILKQRIEKENEDARYV